MSVASSVALVVACATVPITGRSQLRLISNDQLVVAANQQFSQFMSLAQQKNAILSRSDSPEAARIIDMVNRVSERIVEAAGLTHRYKWETVVVKSKQANAFVMPNGKIVVFTGLLPICKNDAGLAAVLGHEVGHVVAQHSAERLSQALLAQLALQTVDAALSESKYRPIVAAAMGLGAQYGVLLPFSREHESESDRIGLLYMAKAGYDPSEAIALWERMEARSGSGPWEFLSTHPSPATRRAQIREWLPEARLYYADRAQPLPSGISKAQKVRGEPQTALTPIASRPLVQPGFWYRIQASNRSTPFTYRFERIETCSIGECLVFASDTGGSTLYTKDYALVEIRRLDGASLRLSPPLQLYRWPLRVGERWIQAIRVEDFSGRAQNTTLKGEVVGYESVTTPAGSLMAFKIMIVLGGKLYQELWYAPEARTAVRLTQYDARGNAVTSELVDYQKTEDAGSVLREK